MPRHLISDAHEWINEIPSVPIYFRCLDSDANRRACASLRLISDFFDSLLCGICLRE